MIVKNNLNRGITLSLVNKEMCVLSANSTTEIKDELLTKEFNDYENIGCLTLIESEKVDTKEQVSGVSNAEVKSNKNKGGKK